MSTLAAYYESLGYPKSRWYIGAEHPLQFDLVFIDHDKRFYPRDLKTLLQRELVSRGGYVRLHDVLGKARRVWSDCPALARAHDWIPSIAGDIVAEAGMRILLREWRERVRRRG